MKANIFFKLARVLLMIAIFGSVFALPYQSTSAQPLYENLDCGNTEIPYVECVALVGLFSSTVGNTWTDNTGWLETNTPCSWYGVSCTAGHVSSLNISSNQLSGTIPMQLKDLTELQTLNLSSNQLSGAIPKELGTLTKLTELDLGANQLSGTIPTELGGLTNLTELDLSSNLLTGPIPTALDGLINLIRLDLSNNSLTGTIPANLGGLTKLTELDLSTNKLSGSIPTALGGLKNLTHLALGVNQLSGTIPTTLGNLTNLTNLDLTYNLLTDTIPTALGGLTNLTALDLSDNLLTGTIPPELWTLSNLAALNLGGNQLTGTIPTALGGLANLTELDLSNNLLTGTIPPEPWTLTNPAALNLGGNQLSGSIPPELGNLTNLTTLSLEHNQLTGTIPPELGELANLEHLYLSSNQLSGTIPLELGSLTKLGDLDLGFNQLTGPIPAELGSLTDLWGLYLAFNQLSGEFPASITNLVNLTSFLFDSCDGLGSTNAAVIVFLDQKTPGWNECSDFAISGNAGVGGANLSYTDGSLKTVTADAKGNYSLPVTYFWSGTVTPSKAGYAFTPEKYSYTQVIEDQTAQNFSARKVITVSSTAAQDGWVLESSESSKAGGTLNSTDITLRLGDDKLKKQYRSILSFNTSGLPDNAVITSIKLKVKKQSVTGGGDPLKTFQGFLVEIKKGFFGTTALQTTDFQTAANKSFGPFTPALASGWYSMDLTSGKAYINKLSTNSGLTQFRLSFKLDDNNNALANYLSLYSGNAPAASRPQLVIQYYVP